MLMSDVSLETSFMLTLGETPEQVEQSISVMTNQSLVHCAIWCPDESQVAGGEWAISPIALGRVIECTERDGMARVKFLTTKGELQLL
jgi:hypothetical protein